MAETYIENLASQGYHRHHSRADDTELMDGSQTVSLETRPELSADQTMAMFAARDRERFILLAEMLPARYQDLLFSFYLLGKTQAQIGKLTGDAQSHVADRLEIASRALAGLLRFAGLPAACVVVPILQRIGVQTIPLPTDDGKSVRLANVGAMIADYLRTRSYAEAADHQGLRRQDTRRAIREIAMWLSGAKELDCRCLGAIIQAFAAFSSASKSGDTKREQRHLAPVKIVDPPALGEFEVRAGKDFPFFAPRAAHAELKRGTDEPR